MVTVSRSVVRRCIRIGSYVFLAVIVACASFLGISKKQGGKYTLEYSLSSNIAQADTPHGGSGDDAGGGDADGSDASDGSDDSPDGCFVAGTPILMFDGGTKAVEDIVIGDRTAGGEVTGVMQFGARMSDLYNYKGVVVTGSHTVNDDGVWRYVKESPLAVRQGGDESVVTYLFNATNHRVYVHGIEFSDFVEVDASEPVRAQYLKDLMWHNQVKVWEREGVSVKKVFSHLTKFLG